MCVCIYRYIYICLQIFVFVFLLKCKSLSIHTLIHTYLHTYMHTHIHALICACIHFIHSLLALCDAVVTNSYLLAHTHTLYTYIDLSMLGGLPQVLSGSSSRPIRYGDVVQLHRRPGLHPLQDSRELHPTCHLSLLCCIEDRVPARQHIRTGTYIGAIDLSCVRC